MLNHKIIIHIGTIILLAMGFAYAGGEEPESLGVKQEAGYRIEVETTLTPGEMPRIKTEEKEIKFVSPKGKIVKTLPYDKRKDWWRIVIAPTFKYLIKNEDTPAEWGKDSLGEPIKIREAKVKFSYINAKAEKKWSKEFEIIYTMEQAQFHESDVVPYFFMISENGEKIVFVKNYEYSSELGYQSDIVVYDTLGNEVASVVNIPGIEDSGDLQISPDGKIVGADVWSCKLFFLDVETGRTKVVKAMGEGWRVSGFPLNDGKIELTLHEYPKSIVLTFDEIPDDLSPFFGGEQ